MGKPEQHTQPIWITYLKIGALTIITGLVLALMGLWLDGLLHTPRPFITIALLILGYPWVLWANLKILRKTIEQKLHAPPADKAVENKHADQ